MESQTVPEAAEGLAGQAATLAQNAETLTAQVGQLAMQAQAAGGGNEFWYLVTIFVLAVFVQWLLACIRRVLFQVIPDPQLPQTDLPERPLV